MKIVAIVARSAIAAAAFGVLLAAPGCSSAGGTSPNGVETTGATGGAPGPSGATTGTAAGTTGTSGGAAGAAAGTGTAAEATGTATASSGATGTAAATTGTSGVAAGAGTPPATTATAAGTTGAAAGTMGTTGAAGQDASVPAAGGDAGSGGDAGPPIIDLFNGTDLTGFNAYEETSNTTSGILLTGAAALAIFQPENGMIHVYGDLADGSTQVHYLLETVTSYSKYTLTWQYQWGTKKFAPYTDLASYPRDAGVLWHIHGDITQVWPSSIEFQNKWGTTGDIFALYARCTSLATPSAPTVFADYDAGGVSVLVNGSTGYVQHGRNADWELMDGGPGSGGVGTGWNSCQLQVDGGAAVYTVNGHIVNRVLSVMDKSGNPVTSGPIGWQGEQAEVYYRNLQIQVFP